MDARIKYRHKLSKTKGRLALGRSVERAFEEWNG